MNPYGEIPIEHVIRMNPSIEDPIKVSEIYIGQTSDFVSDDDGTPLFKIPFSPGTFWTHFKYSCKDMQGFPSDDLEIQVILVTSDNYRYNIGGSRNREQNEWQKFSWAFPSLYTPNSGIYLKIKEMPKKRHFLDIKILGFKEIFPHSPTYLLENEVPEYMFSKNHNNDTIYKVEHQDYINSLEAISIKLQRDY
jgi:hypothetical protein